MLGAQQRAKDGISGHTNTSKIRPLEFSPQIQNFDIQVFNLWLKIRMVNIPQAFHKVRVHPT